MKSFFGLMMHMILKSHHDYNEALWKPYLYCVLSSMFQNVLHETRTTLKMCKHESDYVVLYNYMKMEHLLCHSCWNEEKPVRINEDTVKIFRP